MFQPSATYEGTMEHVVAKKLEEIARENEASAPSTEVKGANNSSQSTATAEKPSGLLKIISDILQFIVQLLK